MTTFPTPGRDPRQDLIDNLVRQAQRQLAKTDVYTYGEYVFGYEAARHHREMIQFAQGLLDRGESGVILAPRGSSKTTWLNTIWLSFLVATRPDIRIGLFSNTDVKAHAMSSAIRWTLSESERFKEVFGDLSSPAKWTDREWLRRDSPHHTSKDRTMVAAGVNPTAVSKRFDLIFCDDVLDEENTYNIDRREKVETWFWKTLKPTLVPGGSVIVVGTRWAEDDLYERLMNSNGWPSLVMQAIVKEPNGAEQSYWPEWWPIDRLHKERADVGSDNFACQYMNDISGLREGTIFRRDWFSHFDDLPSDRRYVFTMGVDLASSERERADYTARVIVAEDNQNHHWVLHAARAKINSGHREFVQAGYDWAVTNGCPISRIVIENNQHQSTLIADLLRETQLPVVGRKTDVDKFTRARGIAPRYESGRVHHHRSLRGSDLETEMTAIGQKAGHDDLVDALGLAMDLKGVSGSFAAVSGALRGSSEPTGPSVGQVLTFATGNRTVPAYLAALLSGIDTAHYTYEEAVRMANRQVESNYVTNALRSVLPRG